MFNAYFAIFTIKYILEELDISVIQKLNNLEAKIHLKFI